MCDNCARLQRQVRELKETLAEYEMTEGEIIDPRIHDLARWMGTRPQAAQALTLMMRNAGHALSHERIARAFGYDGEDARRISSVMQCHLRQAIKKRAGAATDTVWGSGYRLPVVEANKIKVALQEAGL